MKTQITMVVIASSSLFLTGCLEGSAAASSTQASTGVTAPTQGKLAASLCSITQTGAGATITCDDGSTATVSNGAAGATGSAGAQGVQGIQGVQGATGVAGSTGATGSAGSNGTNGSPFSVSYGTTTLTALSNLKFMTAVSQYMYFLNTTTSDIVGVDTTGTLIQIKKMYFTEAGCTGIMAVMGDSTLPYFKNEVFLNETANKGLEPYLRNTTGVTIAAGTSMSSYEDSTGCTNQVQASAAIGYEMSYVSVDASDILTSTPGPYTIGQ